MTGTSLERISPRLETLIESELQPGERVLWRHHPRARLEPARILAALFLGGMFSALGGQFFLSSIAPTVQWFAAAGGLLFFVIGIGLLYEPIHRFGSALRTAYVVTDRRAMSLQQTPLGARIRQQAGPSDPIVRVVERPDGSGDLILKQWQARDSDGDRIEIWGFMKIPDVRAAERAWRSVCDEAPPR